MRERILVALLLTAAAAPVARTQEGDLHAEQARNADALMTAFHDDPGNPEILAAATALRERCIRSGNHRSAEFLAGQITLAHPGSLDDRHRYVEILLARGKTERAERDLRALMAERPSDCTAPGMLAGLLLDLGRPEAAMEVHAAHLREHPGEALPLRDRADIALRVLRDLETARAGTAAMRAGADRPGAPAATAAWLRENADLLDGWIAAAEKDREALRAHSARLDGWLAAAFAAAAAGLAGGFLATRPRN